MHRTPRLLAALFIVMAVVAPAFSQGIYQLDISSDKVGASIYINGNLAGYTSPNFSFPLFPGDYEVRAVLNGYPEYKVGLKVFSSPVMLVINFELLKARMTPAVTGTPATTTTTTTTTTTLPPPPSSSGVPEAPAASGLYPEMVRVPAGTTTASNGNLRLSYPLEVSRHEVTNAQFVEFLNSAKISATARNTAGALLYNISDPSAQIGYSGTRFFVKPWRDFSGAPVDVSAHPVTFVSWHGVVEYCNWLSRTAGIAPAYVNSGWYRSDLGGKEKQGYVSIDRIDGFRMPYSGWVLTGTQSVPETLVNEWEYVFRGGPSGRATLFAGSDSAAEAGWFSSTVKGVPGNSSFYFDQGTMRVGQKKPNELGIHDLSGNAAEWEQGGALRGGSFETMPGPLAVVDFSSSLEGTGRAFGFRVFRTAVRPAVLPDKTVISTPEVSGTNLPAVSGTGGSGGGSGGAGGSGGSGGGSAGGASGVEDKGLVFTEVPLRGLSSLRAIVFGPDRIVIGGNGAIPAISVDKGRFWRTGSKAPLVNITGLAYANGIYLATGDSGGVATSSDGLTWTAQRSGTSSQFNSVVWAGTQFVAVGHNGTIRVSRDGKTWFAQTSGTTSHLMHVVYGRGRSVAVALDGTVLVSTDGSTWSRSSMNIGNQVLYAIEYGPRGFVAATTGDNARIFTSIDGKTWKSVYTYPGYMGFSAVLWDKDRYLVTGNGVILQSADATQWDRIQTPEGKQLNRLASNEDALVVLLYDGSGVLVNNR